MALKKIQTSRLDSMKILKRAYNCWCTCYDGGVLSKMYYDLAYHKEG